MLSSGWSQVGFNLLYSGDAYQEEQPTDCTVIHLALICWRNRRRRRRWGSSVVGLKWVAQAAVLPLALKDMESVLLFLSFSVLFAFCTKSMVETVYVLCVCRVGGGVVMFSAGLQGEVCGSDIRQHAKLRGHPQQWNWRQTNWQAVGRRELVQIASHFHAPTPLALHQGEGGWRGEPCVRVCAVKCVCWHPLGKWMSLSCPSAHVDSRFSHIHTQTYT